MPTPKMDIALNDFSGGQVNSDAKRMNGALALTGGRVMSNMRILNTVKMKNRPGRRAIFLETGKVEKVKMSPGNYFYLAFGSGYLRVYNTAGARLFSFTTTGGGAAIPWATATLGQIRYAIFQMTAYIAFPGMRPQILTWNGVSTWTIADFTEAIGTGGQKRTPFYRLSPKGITLQPSGTTGNITVTFSAAIAVAGMVGTRVRWAGRQILLGSLISSSQMNATVIEALPPSQILTVTGSTGSFAIGDPVLGGSSGAEGIVISTPNSQSIDTNFTLASIGDAVTGASSGATGVVTSIITPNRSFNVSLNTSTAFISGETINGPGWSSTTLGVSATSLLVQILQNSANTTRFFIASEVVAGPSASATTSGAPTPAAPQAIAVWDDEVINSYRGFPASVFVDQFRVGFCNFAVLPNAIAWSAINQSTDLYVDGTAAGAMLELAPNKSQIFDVVPGAEGSEFLFCDNSVYYIPISVGNPLRSGSVAFNQISGEGCYPVQPRLAGQAIIYLAAGGLRVSLISAIGLATRPYDVSNLTEFHANLLNAPVAIAVPTSDGTFSERYAYVLNSDGTIAVGKYSLDQYGKLQGSVGWLPWSGAGTVGWVSALEQELLFASRYAPNGIAPVNIIEVLDDTIYLDGAMFANAIPAAFTPPAGMGPFWWIAGGSVTLMDQGYRPMGIYQVDTKGNIIPQFNGGENLSAATLIGGQAWTAIYEPFLPQAPPGQDSKQRLRRRKVCQVGVAVQTSSGFVFDGERIPPYFQDDDATKPPPLREDTYKFHPKGLHYDPRKQLVKDTPGPLIITEVTIEATV